MWLHGEIYSSSPQPRICVLGCQIPIAVTALKYYMENSRNKQFIGFKLFAVLSSVVKCHNPYSVLRDRDLPLFSVSTLYTSCTVWIWARKLCEVHTSLKSPDGSCPRTYPAFKWHVTVLLPCGHHNRLAQNRWLTTTYVYSITVLEVRSPK